MNFPVYNVNTKTGVCLQNHAVLNGVGLDSKQRPCVHTGLSRAIFGTFFGTPKPVFEKTKKLKGKVNKYEYTHSKPNTKHSAKSLR